MLAFGALATAMAVAGPLTVLRRWLQRFAVWAVLASTAYLTWYALTRFDLGALAGQAGQGGLSFWAGVDLAIALPISWVPLVADYARFGARHRGRPSGAPPSATSWPRSGSSPSGSCSCSPSARAT